MLIFAASSWLAGLVFAAVASADALPGPTPPATGHGPLIAIGVVAAVVVVAAIFLLRRMASRRTSRDAETTQRDAPAHSDRPRPPEDTMGDFRDGRYP
jgi:hypothetical protein